MKLILIFFLLFLNSLSHADEEEKHSPHKAADECIYGLVSDWKTQNMW
jgi:hypothetical protein